MCLLKRCLHTIAKLDFFYPLSDQPAFHDDTFVQYHVDVADRPDDAAGGARPGESADQVIEVGDQ